MTDTHSTNNGNKSQYVRCSAPRSSIAKTASLIGGVMLAGLLAACGTRAPDIGAAAAAAPTHAQAGTVAETHFEAFWDTVKGGAGKAVRGVADWGKDESNESKLKRVTAEIEKARRPFNASAFGDGNAEARASLAVNLARQASLSEAISPPVASYAGVGEIPAPIASVVLTQTSDLADEHIQAF